MRKFGKIETKFWLWSKRNKLGDSAKILAAYLLSGPHANSIGCFNLPNGYMSEDLGWPVGTVTETLSELSRIGFVYRCETVDWVFIPDFLNHNPPENENVGKAMAKVIEDIPTEFSYWSEFIEILIPFGKRFPKEMWSRLQAMPKQSRNPEPEPEPEPTPEPGPERVEAAAVAPEPTNPIPGLLEKRKATRLHAEWTLPDDWREWANRNHPHVDTNREALLFANYWHAKPKDATKLDWYATWQNWVMNAKGYDNGKRSDAGGIVSGYAAIAAGHPARS